MSTPYPTDRTGDPAGYPGEAAAQPGSGGHTVGDASLGQLLGNLTTDLTTLVRQELALARAEVKQEATRAGKGAGAFGGAVLAAHLTLLFLSLALWWALGTRIGHGWSALVVAALWAIATAVLAAAGKAKMRRVHPRPDQTIDTLKTVPDALKGQAGGTR